MEKLKTVECCELCYISVYTLNNNIAKVEHPNYVNINVNYVYVALIIR